MSRDNYTPADSHQFVGSFYRPTTNLFSLPVRPSYNQWDDRDHTSEQLHESAMQYLSQQPGNRAAAVIALPDDPKHQIWEDRGLIIQKLERRQKDCNHLLSKMWRRLDPLNKVSSVLNRSDVQRQVQRQAERAFSEQQAMQNWFNQLAAYDYLKAPGAPAPAHGASADPRLSDEKRINSLATTVKIQSQILQEKNEIIDKLHAQLDVRRAQNFQCTTKQELGDIIARLELQLKKANDKISVLCNVPQQVGMEQTASQRLQAVTRAIRNGKAQRAPPVAKLPETAFGGVPTNHTSLTFDGFSADQNAINPARLQMLTDTRQPVDASPSSNAADIKLVRGSGANMAPLGPLKKKKYDSTMQSQSGSGGNTPMSSTSSTTQMQSSRNDMWSSNAGRHAIYAGSKRPVDFLNYDDPSDEHQSNLVASESPNKRVKSGVLTPPPPEDLWVLPTAELSPDTEGGGVSIKREELDDEMHDADEGVSITVPIDDAVVDQKHLYSDLDEMIIQAQRDAMS